MKEPAHHYLVYFYLHAGTPERSYARLEIYLCQCSLVRLHSGCKVQAVLLRTSIDETTLKNELYACVAAETDRLWVTPLRQEHLPPQLDGPRLTRWLCSRPDWQKWLDMCPETPEPPPLR